MKLMWKGLLVLFVGLVFQTTAVYTMIVNNVNVIPGLINEFTWIGFCLVFGALLFAIGGIMLFIGGLVSLQKVVVG